MKINWKEEAILLLIWIAPVIFYLIVWKSIPDQVPMQYGLDGKVNSTFPKVWYIIMPLILYLLLFVLPTIDPKKRTYQIGNTYFKIRMLLQVFMSIFNVIVVSDLLYHSFSMAKLTPMLVMALFVVLGNYMGNLKQNYFVGFKTPWTLNNEEVWRRTHVLAGKLWVGGGILAIVLMIFLNNIEWIELSILTLICLIPLVYSYWIFKKLEKSK